MTKEAIVTKMIYRRFIIICAAGLVGTLAQPSAVARAVTTQQQAPHVVTPPGEPYLFTVAPFNSAVAGSGAEISAMQVRNGPEFMAALRTAGVARTTPTRANLLAALEAASRYSEGESRLIRALRLRLDLLGRPPRRSTAEDVRQAQLLHYRTVSDLAGAYRRQARHYEVLEQISRTLEMSTARR
jgi:hypothetical protein